MPLERVGVDLGEPINDAELEAWCEGMWLWLDDSGDSGNM